MNEIPGIPPATPPPAGIPDVPTNWRTALADLIGARLALIQLELRQAAASGVKRGLFFGAAALLLLFTWILMVAGVIGAISDKNGFPWYWVALVAGGIHLLLAVIFLMVAKRPGSKAFPHTAEEFKKDRAWLEKFQSPKKSEN